MGKADNKKAAATSSRAAELLAKTGTGGTPSGFGGFSGSAPVTAGGFAFGAKYISKVATEDVTPSSAGPSAIIPAELDGELAQQLQRLAKRDATTRLKALQTLRSLVSEKSEDDVRIMLSPWAYSFGRLVMDTNRSVRTEACLAMGALATAAGRNMAPFIKFVYPYWLLAQHDVSNEVVSAATTSLQATFPGNKAADVRLFCRNEVLKLLSDNASSTPQSLGDARKESPEELQSRHECVLAATCAVLGELIKQSKNAVKESMDTTSSTSTASLKQIEAHNEILDGAKSLVKNASFLKMTLQSKSPLVRRSSYTLIASVCHTAPDMVTDDDATLAVFCPLVFGSIGEKESTNHSPMWDMVLSYASSTNSSSWTSHVNLSKAVLPKLWSLLRHGCYGSAELSYPAVLPFINLIVKDSSSFGYNGFDSLLSAVWDGCWSLPTGSAAQEAAATCFTECYLYSIIKAELLVQDKEEDVDTATRTFCKDLTADVVGRKCLVNAVGGEVQSNTSRTILVKITSKLAEHAQNTTNNSGKWKLDLVISSIGAGAAEATSLALENINAPGAQSLAAIEQLLAGIKNAVGDGSEYVALAAARPVVTALLPYVHNTTSTASTDGGGSTSTAAAALLASLVKSMPDLNIPSSTQPINTDFAAMQLHQSPSFTVESILHRIIEEKLTGAALLASCDLITSCLLQRGGIDSVETQLADCISQLVHNASVEAAIALLTQFISSAPEDVVSAARSSLYDTYFTPKENNILGWGANYVDLGTMLLLGNGTTTSLVSENAQKAAFDFLSSIVEGNSTSQATAADGDEAIESALHVIKRSVFSPALSTGDVGVVDSCVRAVAAAFDVLVDEACAAATLTEEERNSEISASDSEEEKDETHHHSYMYSLAFGLWSMPEKISQLLQQQKFLQDVDDGKFGFIQALTHSISATLSSLEVEDNTTITKTCFAAASCAKMALDALSFSSESLSKNFLLNLEEEIAEHSWYSGFFLSLGDILGWHSMFNLLVAAGQVDDNKDLEEENSSFLVAKILLLSNKVEAPTILITALLERPALLKMVLKHLPEEANKENYDAFSQLLCSALSSSNEATTIATSTFHEYIVNPAIATSQENAVISDTLVPVLTAVAPVLRSSENRLPASGLPQLAQALCKQAIITTENEQKIALIKTAAAACFPAPLVAPPVPRWAPSNTGTTAATFSVGEIVWYRHRDGSWEASEIVSIDLSVDPPSFAVKLATGVRETEQGRLIARNIDDPPPLPVGNSDGSTGSGYTFDSSSGNSSSAVVPVCCLDEEKQALLDLFRACFTSGAAEEEEEVGSPDASSAAILCSAIAWCSSEFSQADWEVALTALHAGMDASALGAAAAAVSVATTVTEEAEKVAGAAIGGAEPSLAFFRQLNHKKILDTSVKGAAAGQAIAGSVKSSLEHFYGENGLKLGSLLQSYCTASTLIATTARTCPFTTWESSQAGVCAAGLDIFISLGKIVALAGGCGQTTALLSQNNEISAMYYTYWSQLSQVVDATVAAADRAFLAVVVERAGARRSEDGVGCTEALLALSLDLSIPESARNAAYRSILLHSELVLDIVRSTGAAGDDDEDEDALLKSGGGDTVLRRDWYEELESGGLLSEVATAASDPNHPCFTTAWGFIVAFLLYSPDSSASRTKLVERIKEAHGLVHALLDEILRLLPFVGSGSGGAPMSGSRRSLGNNNNNTPGAASSSSTSLAVFGAEDTSGRGFSHRLCALGVPIAADTSTLSAYAALLYAGMLRALPVLCRLWYGDLRDKSTVMALEKYTSAAVSAGLLAAEYAAVDQMVAGLDRFEKFSVRANSASREVIASMEVEDGHMIELVIKLPASMPLKSPEAECRRSVGVSEARLRKWLLSITAFLRNRNGAIADALRLWKRNVDTEFEGHDDCLICYSIIQPSTGQLPRLACRCCRKKYHGTCLYKWFHSSGKSNCPHCQSPW